MAYALIDYSELEGKFAVRDVDGRVLYRETAEQIVDRALSICPNLRVNERMSGEYLVQVMAAAMFRNVPLANMAGAAITETPIPQAKVRHITRKDLGKLLPDGWYVEQQLNRYCACWGESLSLPARATLFEAIQDMRKFLAASAKQALDDLHSSMAEENTPEVLEQLGMWSSSDRP
jgi:hypothetical protein